VWAIPLYTESPDIHDFVVQSPGAFRETMRGLWNLAGANAHVELRVVLQRVVVPRIRQLAHFIARNMSFVDHVAWMGLEPMGFARPNWKALWIEPEEFAVPLTEAILELDRAGIATSLFNLPLCVLPPQLRSYAAQSISDWKNVFLTECENCSARKSCCGFFASVGSEHVPKSVHALTEPHGLTNVMPI
jgi:His-Xaa-Ser system radical SAM maturase HxsC